MGLVFVKLVYPFVSSLIEKIPVNIGEISFKFLLVFMCLDMFVSWTAIIRQTLRRQNIESYTIVGRTYDKYYNDERLAKAFPNMRFK